MREIDEEQLEREEEFSIGVVKEVQRGIFLIFLVFNNLVDMQIFVE